MKVNIPYVVSLLLLSAVEYRISHIIIVVVIVVYKFIVRLLQ